MAVKRKKKPKKSPFWIGILAGLMAFFVYVGFQYYHLSRLLGMNTKTEHISYKDFGIDLPPNYTLHGIDVSGYQDKVVWEKVKTEVVKGVKVSFVYVKCTEGVNDSDAFFMKNWTGATENALLKGAYHFFIPTRSGASQAHNFITHAHLAAGDLPPVVDIEQLYGTEPQTMRKNLLQCLDSLERYYGTKPIIYSYIHFYEDYLGKPFDGYPLWIAHYVHAGQPNIKRDWLFWQHSVKGRINGIKTTVDFDVFNGDTTLLNKMRIR